MAKEVACAAPNCRFRIRSEDEEELVSMVQRHARKHNMNLDRAAVQKAAKEAKARRHYSKPCSASAHDG